MSLVAVKGPDGKTALFQALSLMFGTKAAVYAFLRFSRALAAIAAKLLNLFVVEYFDDFTQVEATALSESAQTSLEAVLGMLG